MVVEVVRRKAHAGDLYGKISPCPIPPNPSKKQPDSNPQSPSSPLLSLRSKIRNWLTSFQFAGVLGLSLIVSIFYGLVIAILVSSHWFNFHETVITELGNPFGPGIVMGMYYVNPVAPLFNGTILLLGLVLLVFALYFETLFIKTRSIIGSLGGVFGIVLGCMVVFLALNPPGSPLGYKFTNSLSLTISVIFLATWFLIMVALAPIFLGHDRTASILIVLVTGLLTISSHIMLLALQCAFTSKFFYPSLVLLNEIILIAALGVLSVLFIIRGNTLLKSIR